MASFSSWRERKTPRLRRRLDKSANKPSTAVEPGCRGRSEVEDKAGMAREPFQDLRMLRGGIVVEDDMDGPSFRDPGVDHGQEANELLMAMALQALADLPSSTSRAANKVVVPCRL